jgi:hypothetical protein
MSSLDAPAGTWMRNPRLPEKSVGEFTGPIRNVAGEPDVRVTAPVVTGGVTVDPTEAVIVDCTVTPVVKRPNPIK